MTRSTPEFDQRIADWLEADPAAAPADVLSTVVAALPSIPQARRGLLAPWRSTPMTSFMRAAAGIAIVAVVGVGVLAFNPGILGPGATPGASATAAPSPTAAPTPSAAPSQVAPGITGWTSYTSEVHGFTLGYPEDWNLEAAATREWQSGDSFLEADNVDYADVFTAPEADTIGLFAWQMPAGDGADVESVEGLKAWAEMFCNDGGLSSCEEFAQPAEAMCLNAGGDSCRAALIVPAADQQYAFFVDWESAILTSVPDRVTIVAIGREDGFPSAARYGGSVALLKAILTQMDVWTPGQVPPTT